VAGNLKKFVNPRFIKTIDLTLMRALLARHDGKFPWTYLGKPIEEILAPLELSVADFTAICDRFTNKRIFKLDRDGKLVKTARGDLVRLNADNLAAAA
jgi:hypothetical protein